MSAWHLYSVLCAGTTSHLGWLVHWDVCFACHLTIRKSLATSFVQLFACWNLSCTTYKQQQKLARYSEIYKQQLTWRNVFALNCHLVSFMNLLHRFVNYLSCLLLVAPVSMYQEQKLACSTYYRDANYSRKSTSNKSFAWNFSSPTASHSKLVSLFLLY